MRGTVEPQENDLDWIAEDLRGLALELGDLTQDPANARLHPERNMEALKASLHRFGQRKPVVVRREGMVVIAGNGTLEAARSLGWTHIAAVIVEDDALTATGYAIADNRTAELAEWDTGALARLLESVQGEGLPGADLGFTEKELVELIGSEQGWEEALGDLPEGDRVDGTLRQVTFLLTDDQHEIVQNAMKAARSQEGFSLEDDNQNRNGCAIAHVSRAFLR